MASKVWFFTLVVLTFVVLSSGRGGKRIKVCGDQLGRALQLVCDSKYYGKRALENELKDFLIIYDDSNGDERDNFPFYNPNGKYKTLFNRELSTRGVVEECCHNACTFDMLSLYCER
nr:bombyxin B-1 homolog [Onthophagus taurus]XP_022912330.1 bombyxin B-1 homolog [Onthophagus taurus]